jgi:hypothetical protein
MEFATAPLAENASAQIALAKPGKIVAKNDQICLTLLSKSIQKR